KQAAIDNLAALVCAAAPLSVQDCRRALTCFGPKIIQLYGQVESPLTITVMPKALYAQTDHPEYEHRLSSVGYARSALAVRIADDDGNPCKPGEVGEVLVSGDTVMKGYWRDPVATGATLRGGWLHTGDLAEIDLHGFVRLRGRSKDMIISGGSNVYSSEIE